MVHRRLGAVARVSWGFPHIWPEAQVPFPLEFIPPALHRRSTGAVSTGAPPALSPPPTGLWGWGGGSSNLRRNALSGLQNGRRGPSRRLSGAFSGERVTGVSNARGNPGAVLGTICRDMGGVEVR